MQIVKTNIQRKQRKHGYVRTNGQKRITNHWKYINLLTNAIELNVILERFFANIKNLVARNTSHVRSLHSKPAGIDRQTREMGSTNDIFKDLAFNG